MFEKEYSFSVDDPKGVIKTVKDFTKKISEKHIPPMNPLDTYMASDIRITLDSVDVSSSIIKYSVQYRPQIVKNDMTDCLLMLDTIVYGSDGMAKLIDRLAIDSTVQIVGITDGGYGFYSTIEDLELVNMEDYTENGYLHTRYIFAGTTRGKIQADEIARPLVEECAIKESEDKELASDNEALKMFAEWARAEWAREKQQQ